MVKRNDRVEKDGERIGPVLYFFDIVAVLKLGQ